MSLFISETAQPLLLSTIQSLPSTSIRFPSSNEVSIPLDSSFVFIGESSATDESSYPFPSPFFSRSFEGLKEPSTLSSVPVIPDTI